VTGAATPPPSGPPRPPETDPRIEELRAMREESDHLDDVIDDARDAVNAAHRADAMRSPGTQWRDEEGATGPQTPRDEEESMDRSSDKHGPRLDDEMKKEVEGQVRSGRPTRAEEWHDPEPPEDENSPDVAEQIEARAAAERGRTAHVADPDSPRDEPTQE